MNKKHWLSKDLIGFSLTSFFNDFSHEMITSILPLFITQIFGAANAPQLLGILTGTTNMLQTLGNISAGWLGRNIPHQKTLLILCYGITSFFSCLIGSTHHLFIMIFYRSIAWITRGVREPIRDAWLMRIIQKKDYGKAFGLQRAMDTFGAILGPLCAYYALSLLPLTTIFALALIPGILSVVTLMLLVTQITYERSNEKKQFLYSLSEFPVQFRRYILIRCIFGLAFFDPILLMLKTQENVFTTAILLYSFFNCIRLISEFGTGFLSDYYASNKKKLLAYAGFGSFGLANSMFIFSSSLSSLLISLILVGLSVASLTVLEKAYTAETIPQEMSSDGYGYLAALQSIGFLLSNIIVGSLWTYTSSTIGFIYAAFISFTCMFLLIKLPSNIKSNPY